jgi:hypothetical protein
MNGRRIWDLSLDSSYFGTSQEIEGWVWEQKAEKNSTVTSWHTPLTKW